ncbi:hypothetical protein [Jeongeupia chitinilytica]|uniref:Antibiotic biosynthesis monooxygenase n=1 Tax=Jeongeupia chitinilytica TaxID=1041641 RepID=A0ABQ3H429_9NEIS|nr:hypothetical protein [Jeongeupia chitinilytica]GHD67112.1 hypothetical protein GCM10007350_30350 [Jeongeupia chitinilytica]
MIARSWHGVVPALHGDAFAAYLQQTGVAGSTALNGNLGAFVQRVEQDGYTHFFLLTYWTDWAAIHDFAGPQPHIAVTYPEGARFGLISDPIVVHQQVDAVTPWLTAAAAS